MFFAVSLSFFLSPSLALSLALAGWASKFFIAAVAFFLLKKYIYFSVGDRIRSHAYNLSIWLMELCEVKLMMIVACAPASSIFVLLCFFLVFAFILSRRFRFVRLSLSHFSPLQSHGACSSFILSSLKLCILVRFRFVVSSSLKWAIKKEIVDSNEQMPTTSAEKQQFQNTRVCIDFRCCFLHFVLFRNFWLTSMCRQNR